VRITASRSSETGELGDSVVSGPTARVVSRLSVVTHRLDIQKVVNVDGFITCKGIRYLRGEAEH